MKTPSATIISGASQPFEVQDCLGRKLTIRRINALDRLRLLKAAGPELSQNDSWLNLAALALAVVEVDGIPRTAPTNERQIEAIVAELGDTGLERIAEALNDNVDASLLFDGSPEGNAEGTSS